MKFLRLVPENLNINFIGKLNLFLGFSAILLVAVVAGLLTKGLNYGIDFTGGTVVQVKFNPPLDAAAARQLVTELGEPDASVVALQGHESEYLITSRVAVEKNATPLHEKILGKLGAEKAQILAVDVVGPRVGAELKRAAILSLFYSIILITIYIWFRFDIRFAPGATIAMVHDLLMVTGFYLVTQKEFTITGVAALLTVAGYSVNDTIVIYDRAREMMKTLGSTPQQMPQVINNAVNVTLSRTILTAFIMLVSIVPVIIFCDGELQSFAMAMAFGVFVGIYSTVYIASPFTIYVERFLAKKSGKTNARPATA
jgi:preprotein translocase subunit SecF